MATSALVQVKVGAGAYADAYPDGIDATPDTLVYIRLKSTTDALIWRLTVFGVDEVTITAPSLTNVNPATHEVTTVSAEVSFTYPNGLGRALVFESVVEDALSATVRETCGVYTLTSVGLRVGATNETTEGDSAFGWGAKVNPIIRYAMRTQALTTEEIVGDHTLDDQLDYTPVDGSTLRLYLNGVLQDQGSGKDYTLSGKAITWLAGTGTAVPLELSDSLVAHYQAVE